MIEDLIDLERLLEAVEITGMLILMTFAIVLGIWISKDGITEDTPWGRDVLLILTLVGCLVTVIYKLLGVA
jgi:hypothetical protein